MSTSTGAPGQRGVFHFQTAAFSNEVVKGLSPSVIAPGNTHKESRVGSLLAEALPKCLKPGYFSIISSAHKKSGASKSFQTLEDSLLPLLLTV